MTLYSSICCYRSTHYPRIADDPLNNVHLCGSWEMVVGELDTFGKLPTDVCFKIHIYIYI